MMPDLFDGNPIELNRPADFDIMKWLNGEYHPKKRPHLPPQVDPIVDACIIEMKEKYGVKVGAVLVFRAPKKLRRTENRCHRLLLRW